MLGIDIGNRSIKVCELEIVGATPVVSALACVDLPDGVAPPGGAIDSQRLSAKLQDALRVAGCQRGAAVLNLPVTETAAFERLYFPAMTPQELFAGPLWRDLDARIRFPVDHENVALAFDPADEGPDQAVSVAAIPHATVQAYEQAARGAGLTPIGCTLDGLAWAAWLQQLGVGADAPVMGIYVGSCTTTIVALHRRAIRDLRWIALGGDDVTRELMDQLSLDRVAAERLKRSIGVETRPDRGYRAPHSHVDRAVIDLVEGLADKHAEAIVTVLKGSHGGWPVTPRVLLAGGGSRLDQLAAALRRRWPEPVDQDCGTERVELGPRVDGTWFHDQGADLGPVLGLALGQAPSIPLGKSRKAIPRWKRRSLPKPRPAALPPPAAAATELSPLFNARPGRRPVQAHVLALVLGLTQGVSFVLTAAGSMAIYVEHSRFEANASPATGVVVDHRWFKGAKKNTTRCCAVVEFEAHGRKHQFIDNACRSTCQPSKGATVDVLYRTSDVSDARTRVDVRPLPYFAGVLGPFGIVGGVVGVVLYRRGKRKELG